MFDLDKAISSALENIVKDDENKPITFDRFSDIELKTWQGKRQVTFAKEQITSLTSQGEEGLVNQSQLAFEIDRLAEGYALQGDYEQAYDLAQSVERQIEYKAILNAFNNKECDCPQTIGKGKTSFPTRFMKDKFYHQGNVAELWQCATCKKLTIKL